MCLMFVILLFAVNSMYVHARNPLIGLRVKELIIRQGYPVESHKIITDDGYVLQTIRIPHGKKCKKSERPPVLLFSGVVCCSADWVNMEENSLGFLLADNGYDVWLANARGSTLSKKHLLYNPIKHAKQFWNFSIHEIAVHDIPANIEYIKNVTKEEKVFYVGYSHGATAWFALTASKPEYNERIRLMVGLAPAMLLGRTKNILMEFLHTYMKEISELVELYEFYEFLPHNSIIPAAAELLCNDNSMFRELCAGLFYFIGGFNPEYINKSMIPIIASNTPAGASIIQLKHYVQLYHSDYFQQYDYGPEKNLHIYGTENPPVYAVNNITAPVALYYGSADALVSYVDAERTISALPNVVFAKKIIGYNHFDVIWGTNVKNNVFNSLIKQLKRF